MFNNLKEKIATKNLFCLQLKRIMAFIDSEIISLRQLNN
jgi:hypothetical protein